MPNYLRCFQPGCTAFLTLVTRNRRPWLRDDDAKRRILAALASTRVSHPFRNIGHVLLDDHLHWLVAPAEGTDVSRLISAFKQSVIGSGAELGRNLAIWQRRFYDHVIRDQDDLNRHLDYIHFNPVRHGYCTRPGEYPWSSFAAWCARGAYDSHWGTQEPEELRDLHVE